jgi:hypothetical protein
MSKQPMSMQERHRRNKARQREINAEIRAQHVVKPKAKTGSNGKHYEQFAPDPRPAAITGPDLLLERMKAGAR